MLSLFPRPSKHTLQVRKDHIRARDEALCVSIHAADVSRAVVPSPSETRDVSLSQLPPFEITLQDGDLEILSCEISDLVKGVSQRKWTSTRILLAFIRSARRAHLGVNCITVPNFVAAMKAAKQRDEHFERTGKLVGPLHGVPFSFKENNEIQGLTTSVGYTAWILNGPAKRDSAMAQMVQHLGGIIIVKTNVPQTMMSFECSNPVYGRTVNPWSSAHTPGGSSGGEAAILASDGAAAGCGSDIGGSLRIPTAYCGIYALKPSIGRLPGAGTKSAQLGFEGIPCVYSFMTRSSADLELLFREAVPLLHPSPDSHLEVHQAQARFGSEPLRPAPLRPAWFDALQASEARGEPLRIGYYYCDGFTKTSPACIRGIKESIEALESTAAFRKGQIQLVEIDPTRLEIHEAMHIFTSQITADRCSGLLAPLRKGKIAEAMDFSLFLVVLSARGPSWVTKVLYWVVRYLIGDKTLGHLLTAGGGKSAGQYFNHVARRDVFRSTFRQKVWDYYRLDGIICPTQASPAVSHGGCTKLSSMAASTILYNVLDLSVSICPVTRVDAGLDAISPKGRPPSVSSTASSSSSSTPTSRMTLAHYQEWNTTPGFSTCSSMNSHALYGEGVYDAEKMAGLPVGVQVVAREHEEEKSIGLMRLLDQALREVRSARGTKEAAVQAEWGPGLFTRLAVNG